VGQTGVFGTVTPDMVEDYVAATLWDLFDAGPPEDPGTLPESHDMVSRHDTYIFQIFDRELDIYGKWPTISDFHNAWVARGLDHAGLDRILRKHGITEPAGDHDALE